MSAPRTLRHALSIDVECFHQYNRRDFLGELVAPTPEVERNTHYFLDRLDEHGVKATFFVLGNVAVAFPGLVRRIAAEGHEVAVHGHDHRYLHDLDATGFERELRLARDALAAAAQVVPVGHRAPRFSLSERSPYAYEVLARNGFTYDSSIVPAKGAHGYGDPEAPRAPFRHASGIVEVPLTAVEWLGKRLPAAGGGYVRYFPLAWTEAALRSREREGLPAVTYFHPYEFELFPAMPALGTDRLGSRLRYARFCAMQSVGRGLGMRHKLRTLLDRFAFTTVLDLAGSVP